MERTDREGVAERAGLDQADFDSFFTRNVLKQKCMRLVNMCDFIK